MLKLLKEADHQENIRQEIVQRERNIALEENYKHQKAKTDVNQQIFCGENIRKDLQNIAQRIRDKECKQNIFLCEESLGKELGERKLNREREEKIRQLLWETAPELKDLKKAVSAADVAKGQAMKIAQNEAQRMLQKQEVVLEAEESARQKEAFEIEEKLREEEEAKARLQYHRELDELREFRIAQDSDDGGQLEREKAAIDEMKRKIIEEDFQRVRDKIEKQKQLHRQMIELQKMRDELKLQDKLKETNEANKVDEYRKAQELREREQVVRRRLELDQRLAIQEELLKCLEGVMRDKLRWEEVRTELAIEEKEVREKERSHLEEVQKKKLREDLQKVYDMQLRVKKQQEDLLRKEEELFRENLMSKLYEEDKLDLMGQNKRRQKQLEHKKAVEAMLLESRLKKAAERAREMADFKYQEQLEEERRRMVNEEKIRFLKENACDLLGYLPKGVLGDQQTVERLGDEFKKFYLHKQCQC